MSRWWGRGYTHSQSAMRGGHSGARLHKPKGGLGSFERVQDAGTSLVWERGSSEQGAHAL